MLVKLGEMPHGEPLSESNSLSYNIVLHWRSPTINGAIFNCRKVLNYVCVHMRRPSLSIMKIVR